MRELSGGRATRKMPACVTHHLTVRRRKWGWQRNTGRGGRRVVWRNRDPWAPHGRHAGAQAAGPGVAGAVESGWARYFLLGISAFDGKF